MIAINKQPSSSIDLNQCSFGGQNSFEVQGAAPAAPTKPEKAPTKTPSKPEPTTTPFTPSKQPAQPGVCPTSPGKTYPVCSVVE